MRLERAADSVAANTPTVMRGGTTLMSYGGRRRGKGKVNIPMCIFFLCLSERQIITDLKVVVVAQQQFS